MTAAHFQLMARFNEWANGRIHDACAELEATAYHRDRGAFFGSIHGTLNHLLLVDRLWLCHLEKTDPPPGITRLDHELFGSLAELRAARHETDRAIIAYTAGIDDSALAAPLAFRGLDGSQIEMRLNLVLAAIFNHHTHHRGQVHNMLSQAGVTPPELDIPEYLFDAGTADAPV